MTELKPLEIAEKIIDDLSGRCGLSDEWGNIDPDMRGEIKEVWAAIIQKAWNTRPAGVWVPEEKITAVQTYSKLLFRILENHNDCPEGCVIPNLIDTDDNAGQRLKDAIAMLKQGEDG